MRKTTRCGTTWEYPLNRKSNFKCEGHRGFWTILDAATYKNEVHVLLEHNTYGDETPFLLAVLPYDCLRWYIFERGDKQEKSFFIREQDILNDGWDSIEHLIMEANDRARLGDIEIWTEEEIDNMEVM